MDKKQGSDDIVKRNLDDDTEGQRVTRRDAVPDDAPRPDEGIKRGGVTADDETGPDEAVKRGN